MDPFILVQRRDGSRCSVKGCRGHVSKSRTHGPVCRRCADRRYKALHPYTYALNKLRNNAKRRKIPFDLTLEEFIMFCDVTGYMGAAGRFADDLSIDRIRDWEGYNINNIRTLTVGENSRKQHIRTKLEKLMDLRTQVADAINRLQKQLPNGPLQHRAPVSSPSSPEKVQR